MTAIINGFNNPADSPVLGEVMGRSIRVGNRAPVAQGTISNMSFIEGDAAKTVDVTAYFNDLENDVLIYGAESDNRAVATVSVTGSSMMVSSGIPGETTITVTATDEGGSGQSAEQSFTVTVEASPPPKPSPTPPPRNRAPEVEGSIRVPTMTEDGRSRSIGLSSRFSDPDGDELTYTARSSRPSVVRVRIVSGTSLRLTPVGTGSAQISVTASDQDGEEARLTFTVRVRAAERPTTPTPVPSPPPRPVVPHHYVTGPGQPVPVGPDSNTVIMLSGGEVTLTLPVGSRESAYQVKIDTDMESCESEGAPEGPVAACVTVEILDIDGNPEEDVALDHAATLEFRLSPARVAELGGQSALSKASAEGRIKLLTRDGPGDSWTEVPFAIFLTDDGGALFVASSIMHFSEFALVIVPALPSVGDVSIPGWVLPLVALVGALAVVAGIMTVRRQEP